MKLNDKWIVITGGSSGIGAAIAERAGRRGNRISLIADKDEPLLQTATKLRALGVSVDAIRCDLGDDSDIDRLAEQLMGKSGVPDVLINNAGFGTYRTFIDSSVTEIDRLLSVNFRGHVRLTRHLAAPMASRRSGAICFMASVAGRLPITPNATYCAAKHGMIGLADALRFELTGLGVEVTAICPGRVDTKFFDHETFRQRTIGPENKSSISAERVADATLAAIESNRRITYIPRVLGPVTWAFEAFPLATRPIYARIMRSRMERLELDEKR